MDKNMNRYNLVAGENRNTAEKP